MKIKSKDWHLGFIRKTSTVKQCAKYSMARGLEKQEEPGSWQRRQAASSSLDYVPLAFS